MTQVSRRGSAPIVAAVAIAVIVLIAAVAFLLLAARARARGARPVPEPTAAVALLAPLGELAEIPRVFSWSPAPSAASYRVTIGDEDALWPLFVKTTNASALPLDEKDVTAITRGRIHAWDVVAFDAAGAPLARGYGRFRVRLPGER